MKASDTLVKELAQTLAMFDGSPMQGRHVALAKKILSEPRFIKHMAEGLGYEVTEKPPRYTVVDNSAMAYVHDNLTGADASRFYKTSGNAVHRAERDCDFLNDVMENRDGG